MKKPKTLTTDTIEAVQVLQNGAAPAHRLDESLPRPRALTAEELQAQEAQRLALRQNRRPASLAEAELILQTREPVEPEAELDAETVARVRSLFKTN